MTFLTRSNDRLRHENATLRAELSACRTTTAAQAEVIKAQRANLDALRMSCQKLIAYRDRNTSNFQLEKADDFIYMIRTALEGVEPEEK